MMLQEHGFCFPSLFRLVGHRGEQQSPAPLRFLFLLPVVLPTLPGSAPHSPSSLGLGLWFGEDVCSPRSPFQPTHHRVPVATQPGKVVLAQTRVLSCSVLSDPRPDDCAPNSPAAVASNAVGDVTGRMRPGERAVVGGPWQTVQCASVSACEKAGKDFSQMVSSVPHPPQRQWIYKWLLHFSLYFFIFRIFKNKLTTFLLRKKFFLL